MPSQPGKGHSYQLSSDLGQLHPELQLVTVLGHAHVTGRHEALEGELQLLGGDTTHPAGRQGRQQPVALWLRQAPLALCSLPR